MTSVEPPVLVTPAAAARALRLAVRDGRPGLFLRLGVKGGGCSGFEYTMAMDDVPRDGDERWTIDTLEIAVDRKSLRFLKGATFDATANLIGGGFKFENPNVLRSCGCGTSFTPR